MTDRHPDVRYRDLVPWVRAFVGRKLKSIHTAAPGIVRSYDAASRRAVVQPALLVTHTDGHDERKPPLLDVPVLHPAGGGLLLHLPLAPGDPVLCVFSERGITAWKASHGESRADAVGILSERDAVAIPGFGPAGASAAIRPGASLQTEDGAVAIQVEAGGITLRGDVTVTGALAVDGDLTQDGTDVGAGHKHPKEDTSFPPEPTKTGPASGP